MLHRFRCAVSKVVSGVSALPISEESPAAPDHGDASHLRPRSLSLPAANQPPTVLKYGYDRPMFLQLNAEEVQVATDTVTRPILVPRDISRIPWNAGYAEVINAGKSKLNEDQGWTDVLHVPRHPSEIAEIVSDCPDCNSPVPSPMSDSPHSSPSLNSPCLTSPSPKFEILNDDPLPFVYFGLFDGHAGTGAAIMAARLLHKHMQVQLSIVRDHIIAKRYNVDIPTSDSAQPCVTTPSGRCMYPDHTNTITLDELIVGAIETAFESMDEQIKHERLIYKITGGCTAISAVFFLGKLYVANAGDSRTILCLENHVEPMSFDFTPDSEKQRILYMGLMQPHLMHGDFTAREFPRRIYRRDIGKKILYKDPTMNGWSYKKIAEHDIKFPLVSGAGKRARLLATIGVTRGFGDFDLKVQGSDINIKPFLLAMPEVKIYDLNETEHSVNDVIIMGTDGLWDVTSNDRAAQVVRESLEQFDPDDRSRYTSAAQDLVMYARGLLKKGWRTPDDTQASGDDICSFVVPLYKFANVPYVDHSVGASPFGS